MKLSDLENYKSINEAAGVARVLSHSLNKEFAILTAFRGEHSFADNLKRNDHLKKHIRGLGLGYIPVEGHYVENAGTPEEKKVTEESFIVVNKDGDLSFKDKMVRLGQKFDQESILIKPKDDETGYLVDVNNGSSFSVGKFTPGKFGDYYSILRGKPFTFTESVIENGVSEIYPSWIVSDASNVEHGVQKLISDNAERMETWASDYDQVKQLARVKKVLDELKKLGSNEYFTKHGADAFIDLAKQHFELVPLGNRRFILKYHEKLEENPLLAVAGRMALGAVASNVISNLTDED